MGNLTVKESGEMVNFISPNVNNITSFKVHFSPRQEGSGNPSPENVREITGWNGVSVNTAQRNLYGNTKGIFRKIYIPAGTTWTASCDGGGTVYIYDANQKIKNSWAINGTDEISGRRYKTITVSSYDIYYVRIIGNACQNPQFEFGTLSEYEPAIENSIGFSSDVGTVYGGYVDLISGELVQEWYSIIFNGENVKVNRDYMNDGDTDYIKAYWVYFNPKGISDYNCKCNTLKITYNHDKTRIPQTPCLFLSGNGETFGGLILGKKEDYPELAEGTSQDRIDAVNNWFKENPTQIIYKLKTPITHQLTPQQLSTLKGQNNFWSNADYIEIEYELTETFDIQKAKRKIILNQPHVESASGDLVTFDTDMRGKLKECKVYFSPVQEGEGDPSPDNVRNIVGWNGVSVGLPDEYQEVEYIEKNINNQYIDTGILGNGELQIDCKINISQINNGAPFFGSYGNSQRSYFLIQNNGDKVGYSYITTTYSSVLLNENKDYHINTIFNSGEQSLFINDELILSTNTIQSLKTDKNIYLFGYNFNGTFDIDRSGIFKLYYFKLYQDGTLIRNFIPCYRKSDNEIGMYDTVSKQFFTNQGTGTFLKGDDVDRIHGSIDWTNDVGTVYGGYVDLVSGELVQTWYKLIFDGVNQKMNRDYTDNQYIRCNQVYFSPLGINGSPIRCNNLPLCIQTTIKTTPCFWSSNNGSKFGGIVLGTKEEYPDLAEATAQQRINYVNDWLKENPTTVVYKLTTPIHYQLTPQQLITLRGTNNIYSNTNGQTEIKYWKH